MADEAAAEQYLKDNQRPWLHRKRYSPWPPARKRASTVWRMIWRHVAADESSDWPAESMLTVGTSAPAVQPEEDGSARAVQLQLYREFAHPAPGCPRFCSIYDPPTAPPPSQADDTVIWRLTYRRIPPPD